MLETGGSETPREGGTQHTVLCLLTSWLGIFGEVQWELNAEQLLIPVTTKLQFSSSLT